MSIQNIPGTQPKTEPRTSAAGRSRPAGSSFQDQLAQTTAAAQSKQDAGRAALAKDSLLTSLFDFKTSMLERMKKAKENEEEQEAWDKLMKYLDAWIESLREEGDVRKIARAHAALTSLQADAESERPDLGDSLLSQLEALLV